MKLEHLTNRSNTSFEDELVRALAEAREFSIATAFINSKAIDLIEQVLNNKDGLLKRGKILTGLCSYFNKKADLQRLLVLTNKYPDKLSVHISLDKCFHWKYYHFTTSRQRVFYMGSANFTTGGMCDNGEIILKLSHPLRSEEPSLEDLMESFDNEWTESKPLSVFPIKQYQEAKQLQKPAGSMPPEIKAFFSTKKEEEEITDDGKAYAKYLDANVSSAAYEAVQNQRSYWLKKKWDWFVVRTESEFEACNNRKFMFIFLKHGRGEIYCSFAERKAKAKLNTPDGRYFIAYKPIRTKKLKREHREALRKAFNIDLIGWKDPFDHKILGVNQVKNIRALLGFKEN